MRINILHVRSTYGREGGPESLILSLIRTLDPSQFTTALVTLRRGTAAESSLSAEAKRRGLRTGEILWHGIPGMAGTLSRLRTVLRESATHVMHSHDVRADFLTCAASALCNIPAVTSVHGWVGHPFKVRMHDFADKALIRCFDRIIVNSRFQMKQILHMRVPQKKVALVYNAVDTARFSGTRCREDARRELGIEPHHIVVLTVGRLSEEKGHRYLLDAATLVAGRCPDVRFVIAGEGPTNAPLRAQAHRLSLNGTVSFTGFYEDLPRLLQAADIFGLPSLTEGLPVSVLEAMAAGKPVIATAVGGVPEVVRDGETGLLVRARDAQGFAAAITRLAAGPDTAVKFGTRGRALVEQQFSARRFADEIGEIYREIGTPGYTRRSAAAHTE